MKENENNDESAISRVLGHLAAEKKKTGIAVCLIAVMAVMWGKVLMKKGPQTAAAGSAMQQTDVEKQLDEAMKITYVELPEVAGRDDLISRDFFSSHGWEDFKSDDQEEVAGGIENEGGIYPIDDIKEVAAVVAEHVRLQAIVMGQKPQAFINGRLISQGGKLVVKDGDEMYECEVLEIRENSVSVRCREINVELKLIETAEGDG